MVEGNINELVIINPPDKSFEFIMGESRILKYTLHNTGEFPIKDFNVDANSVLKIGDKAYPTRGDNYVKVKSYPKTLMPGQKGIVEVEAVVPFDYNEIIKRDDKETLWPYRIALTIKSIKHIQEI
jgi:hypothetical protein